MECPLHGDGQPRRSLLQVADWARHERHWARRRNEGDLALVTLCTGLGAALVVVGLPEIAAAMVVLALVFLGIARRDRREATQFGRAEQLARAIADELPR